MKILATNGILGYGSDAESREATNKDIGLAMAGSDAGSTDPGPFYLGSGKTLCSRAAVKRDLASLISVARANNAPAVVGTAGGSGTNAHVEWTRDIAKEILQERQWHAKVALIRAEVPRETLVRAVNAGRVQPIDGVEALSLADAEAASTTVAMMGIEPINEALRNGADLVLAGRASDAAIFAALPISKGVSIGAAYAAGKLLECGATCADPWGIDAMMAEFEDSDSFLVYPPNRNRRCTVKAVVDQFLHENGNQFLHRESPGMLDLREMKLVAVEARRAVRVSGAKFEQQPYTVKLEGVARRGYRKVVIAATHDPGVIARLDDYLENAKKVCREKSRSMGIEDCQYRLHAHRYGQNGVLGPIERNPRSRTAHEVALVIDVVGESAEIAQSVASALRTIVIHTHFPGRLCNEGNFAVPFSPPELDGGEVFEFAVWHALRVEDPLALFPIEYLVI